MILQLNVNTFWDTDKPTSLQQKGAVEWCREAFKEAANRNGVAVGLEISWQKHRGVDRPFYSKVKRGDFYITTSKPYYVSQEFKLDQNNA